MPTLLPHDRLATPGIADSPLASFAEDPIVGAETPLEVQETEDGGAEITLSGDEEGSDEEVEFYANLAEVLEESELQRIATDLERKFAMDKQAREKRDAQQAEAIKRSGMGNEAPGGADFDGASRAVHPMIAEACVDFAASSMREVFPPDGPVRQEIKGEQTQAKVRIAEKQREGLNWVLTEWMPDSVSDRKPQRRSSRVLRRCTWSRIQLPK